MKLYDVPRHSTVILEDGQEIYFYRIDGAYSYCKNKEGNVVHLPAWSDVTIKEPEHEPRRH